MSNQMQKELLKTYVALAEVLNADCSTRWLDENFLLPVSLLRVKLVGSVLLNQFIVQTEDQNRGSPLPDKKSLMVSI